MRSGRVTAAMRPTRRWCWLGSIGVVYGDIGTSPLYTMREAFGHAGGLHLGEAAVLGVLSLIFWSLILIVTLKYVVLILRADNRGEGGVLALGTLAQRALPGTPALRRSSTRSAIAGAGAVLRRRPDHARHLGALGGRGSGDRSPALEPYVVPIAALDADRPVPGPEPRHGAASARSSAR